MKKTALILGVLLACLFMITACDKDSGSGGAPSLGGADPQNACGKAVPIARLTGPDATFSQYTTFTCTSKEAGAGIIARQWRVTGNGTIEGTANQKTVQVKAAANGAFKVMLRVLSDEKVWSHWAEKPVAVNLPGFVITLDTLADGDGMTGSPASGSAAVFSMNQIFAHYQRYWINFDGDTSGLPAQVPVTITWSGVAGSASLFKWATYDGTLSGSQTVNIPLGGGSIGMGGTIIDTYDFRPAVFCGVLGVTVGAVTFSAPGVNTLTITVVRP